MKTVIINVNLEYEFDVETEEAARLEAQNVELPKEYVCDSFELVQIL